SRAEEEDGDVVAASDHAERVLRIEGLETDLMLELLYRALRATHLTNDLITPAGLLAKAAEILRAEPGREGDLLDVLLELGSRYEAAGSWGLAGACYEESLALARRLREEVGDTPQALRDLSVSLNNVGEVRREAGDLVAAAAAYEESLALARR